MSYLPNSYQNNGSGKKPEEDLNKYAKVVAWLVQQNELSDIANALMAEGLLPPQLVELLNSLNGLVIINPDEYTQDIQNYNADKNTLPASVKNLLNLFSFYRHGTYVLPIKDGVPDWGNTENDVSRNTGGQSPLFGRLPTSGNYSNKQKELIILLCHIPFKNGKIIVAYKEGVPESIHCKIKDNIWLETG